MLIPDCRLHSEQEIVEAFAPGQRVEVEVVRVADPQRGTLRVVFPGDVPHEYRRHGVVQR